MAERKRIDLIQSVCTKSVDEEVHAWDEPGVLHLQNTGIERDGGIANLYQKKTTFATAGLHSMLTKSGELLQVDSSHNVRINDSVIGNVGTHAVSLRGALREYSDAAWTATNTIIGIVKVGGAIRVDEYNPATGSVINTRSTTFTMPAVAITSVSLVKYMAMAFADSLEFVLSNNRASYLLRESSSYIRPVGDITYTNRVITAKTWSAVCWANAQGKFVAVSADGVNSYYGVSTDGTSWSTGALANGSWNSVAYSPSLNIFVAVSSSTNYAASSPDGSTWSTRTLAAGTWLSVCWSPQLAMFMAMSSGGSYAYSTNGTSWTTGAMPTGVWRSVCWSSKLGIFCACGNTTNYIATSDNGTTWNVQTAPAGNYWAIAWSEESEIFCAISTATTASVVSSDGMSWDSGTLPNTGYQAICWIPELAVFVVVGNTSLYSAMSHDGKNWIGLTLSANNWLGVAWSSSLAKIVTVGLGVTNYAASGVLPNIRSVDFCWKFYASNYIFGGNGKTGTWYIGDIAGVPTAITDATWCAIDQFAGTAYSRAILTFNVKKNAANLLTGIGEVGYTQAGVYSATPVYYGVALAAVTATFTENVSGPGYAEATFTRSDTGTAIFYYLAPIMGHLPGLWYDYQQSQTHTLCNGYGRLTDFVGNTLGATCSLRVPMLNGQPGMISAGIIGTENTLPMDCLGVPITNVGEFDEYFVPHVVDDGSARVGVIYRYNGVLFYFVIESGAVNTLQRVSDDLYLVNTLSPVNAVNVPNRSLMVGSSDYNGRMLLRSAGAIGSSSTKAVGIIQGEHANSIDTGDKLITQTFSTATNLIPAIELPSFVDRAVPDFGVNVYLEDLYSTTYQSVNVTAAKGDLAQKLYLADTRIPFAIGYTFIGPVMQTEIETIFSGVGSLGAIDVEYDYLCYEIGNQVAGRFQSFSLFGQTYLFDGVSIYSAQFSGSVLIGKQFVAPATGLVYLGAAPTMAFFLSAFDNGVFTFDGGRALSKFERFSQEPAITGGLFSVNENTLLLETATSFLWLRDAIITRNLKESDQTGITLFDTADGIVIANTTTSWQYTYASTGSTSVVPLTWQSGYCGTPGAQKSVVTEWVLTVFNTAKTRTVITGVCRSFDVESYAENTVTWTVNPGDWAGVGYTRLRIRPKTGRCLASSVGISTSTRVILQDVVAEIIDDTKAIVPQTRSR